LPPAAQTIWRKTFNNALKQYGNETTARRVAWSQVKRQYRKGKDGKWVKKEEEITLDIVESAFTVLEEREGGELSYEGTALIDNVVSHNRRYYPAGFNDRAMERTRDRIKEPNVNVTVFSRHGRAVGSIFSLPTGVPIGKVEGLNRSGDRIKYTGVIVPTAEGKDMQVLVRRGVMCATSVRFHDVNSKIRKLDGKEVEEMIDGVIVGIDFCEAAGIVGAGVDRILEEAPIWDEEEKSMNWEELTLEQLKENRQDLLDAYAVGLVTVLNTRVTELQTKVEEIPGQFQGEIEQRDTQVAQLALELEIEKAAQTGVGVLIAGKLRDKQVKSKEDVEEALPEVVAAARVEYLASLNLKGDEADTTLKGQTKLATEQKDEDKEPLTEEQAAVVRLSA